MERGKGLLIAALAAGALGLALGFVSGGCGSAGLRVYKFETPSRDDASAVILQALSDLDYLASPAPDDPNRLQAEWKATGVRYGYAGGRPAQLVRRVVVELLREDEVLIVQVKMELLACSEVATMSGEFEPGEHCNRVTDSRAEDQRETDRIGVALEQALVQR